MPRTLANLSLRWIVAAGYTLALVAALSLMGLLLHHQVEAYLLRSAEVRLMEAVWALHPPPPEGPRGPMALTREEALDLVLRLRQEGFVARLLDARGNSLSPPESRVDGFPKPTPDELAQAGPRPHSKLIDWRPPPPRERDPRGGDRGPRFRGVRHGDHLVSLIRVGEEEPLFLQMGTFWAPSRDFLAALAEMLVTSAGAALVVGLLVSFWLARSLARPLERMAAAANRVAAGDLKTRAGLEQGSNEILAVSAAFDAMVEQLEEAIMAQRRFLADASHELRSPLTSISGVAELLPDATEDERGRALAVLEREAARMNRLVDDLLTLSRAESGEGTMILERLDFVEVVRETVDTMQLTGPERRFDVQLQGRMPMIGDRHSLLRAVRNVLENAVTHAPTEQPIRIEGRGNELVVTDNGPGIADGDLARIFERFYRADRSRARRTGGSGLGLAIVKAILEAHGGKVSIVSGPGRGTSVRFSLPVRE